nr:cation:proton antiporter [Limisphaera ngatamarikiensis]
MIRDLALVWLVAGLVAWACVRLRLSAVVGYLLAGMCIGPHTPPFALIRDRARVELLAELGLVFLIFSIGLNLNVNRFRSLGWSVVVAAAAGAMLILQLVRLLGWALGLGGVESLFLAGVLMVSSSAVITKVLQETQQMHDRPGQLALGITLMEDLVAVVMLTVLTSAVHLGTHQPALGDVLGGLLGFVVLVLLLTLLVVPRLLGWLAREERPEIRTLVVGGLLLGLAWLAVRAGYSLALGAFLFGLIVGGTRYRAELERVFDGLQQAFGALFFVAIGMQVNPGESLPAWPWALGLAALAWVVRPLACGLALLITGVRLREALQAGLLLTPLGEFSFVLAQLAVGAGVLPDSFYAGVVGAALLTGFTAPMLARRSETWSWRVVGHHPVTVGKWVGLYGTWLGRLRTRMGSQLLWRLIRRPALQILAWTAVLTALMVTVPRLWRVAGAWLAGAEPPPWWWIWALGMGVGLLALPIGLAVWRNLGVIAMVVAEVVAPDSARQKRLRALVEMAVRLLGTLGLVFWMGLWLPPGVSLVGGAGAALLTLVAAAWVFRRSLIRWQSLMEIELRREWQPKHGGARTPALSALSEAGPWPLDLAEVELPGQSAHAGRSLGELRLRERFGCTVVGIERQDWPILNPDGRTVLFPHDKLLVLGGPDALPRALEFLHQQTPREGPSGFDNLALETVVVPPDSPLAGRTLKELQLLQRFGVQVVAIQRQGTRRTVPTGEDRIQADDQLLVLGTHEQIREFTLALNRRD